MIGHREDANVLRSPWSCDSRFLDPMVDSNATGTTPIGGGGIVSYQAADDIQQRGAGRDGSKGIAQSLADMRTNEK
jgi:hypothetical protein